MSYARFNPLVAGFLLLIALLASAQMGTTSLRGVISDPKGAVLPGATAKLTDPQTGWTRTVQTQSDGTYQFLQIPPSRYVVEVSATGFATMKRENVRLQVAATRIEVEVTGEAPLVNTQDASIGNAFTARQLVDLPSEGRDPVAI